MFDFGQFFRASAGQLGYPLVGFTQPYAEHIDELQCQIGILASQFDQWLTAQS